jgi:hypothetical protein
MNKLQELSAKCKVSFTLDVNPHRTVYDSVENYLFDFSDIPTKSWQVSNGVDLTDEMLNNLGISKDTLDKMIGNDSIVELVIFPNTPVSHYRIYSHDIDSAINEALELLS